MPPSPRERLRELDALQRHAVLATEGDGKPYTSLVAFALSPDGAALLFPTSKHELALNHRDG